MKIVLLRQDGLGHPVLELENRSVDEQKKELSNQRRMRADLDTPVEAKLRALVNEIEELGCDQSLTETIVLLDAARNKVADFIDARNGIDASQLARREMLKEQEEKFFAEINKWFEWP